MNILRSHGFLVAILAFAMWALPFLASAQANRPKVGDLVEFVSGLGPTLAEIMEEPDPSGYVVIQLPTGKKMPVNANKLRLVQRAGTPNAAIAVGTPVSWESGHLKEKGQVTKVNGNWCQVSADSATTVGWVPCSDLRTGAKSAGAAPPAKDPARGKSTPVKLPGKWHNADGTFKLVFQSGGKCFISMGPMTSKCTYRQTGGDVTVTFEGEDLALTGNDDGSLSSSDPDATIPLRFTRQ